MQDMIFKRKIYNRLLDWKHESNGTKSILIEGARRIGKSTIAEEFGRNEYKSYLIIDFNTASDTVKDAFRNHIANLDTFYLILSTSYNVTLTPRKSLIILDEIQQFPIARQSLKYLVADGRFDFIATGSLISIRENVDGITLPSEERTIRMYPLDFEEFLWGMNEHALADYIRKCFTDKVSLEEGLHKQAMLLFRQYIVVGGMPKVLATYIKQNKNFAAADREKRDILHLYRNDIMKIRSSYKSTVLAIFDQIPAFLSKSERRVMFSSIEKGGSFPRYHDTFFWLADSMMVNECFNCNDPNVGLSLNEDRTYVKCYMCDTGLLISHTFSENEIVEENLYQELILGKLSVNEGMFYENAVAQMLVAAGHKLFFYTRYNQEKHRNDIEIDFLISNASKIKHRIFPIEVKSTERYSTTSLNRFNEIFHSRIGASYILHPQNLRCEGDTLRIPAYMTFCL